MEIYGLWNSKYERWFVDSTGIVFSTPHRQLAVIQRDIANSLQGEMIGAHKVGGFESAFGIAMEYEEKGHWSVRDIEEER